MFTVADLVTGVPFVWQVMVYVLWAFITGDIGEPAVKEWFAADAVLGTIVPEGPVTAQDCTPFALQVICEVEPRTTRDGLAVMVAPGASTSIDQETVGEVPPGPVQESRKFWVPTVLNTGVVKVPEVPLAVKPVPVQTVALVEDQVRIADWLRSSVVVVAVSVAVGVKRLQLGGLFAPPTHAREPFGFPGVPPIPEHPVPLQAAHDVPLKKFPSGHCVQVGGLFAKFVQVPAHATGSFPVMP